MGIVGDVVLGMQLLEKKWGGLCGGQDKGSKTKMVWACDKEMFGCPSMGCDSWI